MPENSPPVEPLYQGRFLHLVQRGRWEYVTRPKVTGVVAVVAELDDGRVILNEQHRPAVDAAVIELPAGLAGDTDDRESLRTAAQRELEEETGYRAQRWTLLETLLPSPGLTDEAVTFFLAQGLHKVGEGGGVDGEAITVHAVHPDDLPDWSAQMQRQGRRLDMKVFAGLHLARVSLHP